MSGAGIRGRSAGKDGSHAGRSGEGARMRGGVHRKIGGPSGLLAVEASGAAQAAKAASVASRAGTAAVRVTVRTIDSSLAGAPPQANGGSGCSTRSTVVPSGTHPERAERWRFVPRGAAGGSCGAGRGKARLRA